MEVGSGDLILFKVGERVKSFAITPNLAVVMPHGLVGGSGWPVVSRVGAPSAQLPPVCIYTLLGGSLLLKKPDGSGNNRPFSHRPFPNRGWCHVLTQGITLITFATYPNKTVQMINRY